ncbi:MAG TPA: Gfo/Idh/MocA family oxidoreductase [Pyrinomonadaceae bacterium]|nr:Gfo/Idh/MocA family oxidoreductase [Pyrinomonadaceae bacterium]
MAELKLKWGLIGCGDIARRRVAPALRDAECSELIAVSRARSELAASFARDFGAKRWYADWRDLLKDDEIDAVYIATPVHLHAEQAIAAAEAGKHVLCEKPMAMNVGECERMIDAARSQGIKLSVAYYRHFYPVVERIKEIIKSGEIGVPVLAQLEAFGSFNPVAGDPRSWFLKKQLAGGGPMFDFGCHRIEVLLNIFGPISKVKALIANTVFDREVEDTAAALFRFTRGVCAVLSVSHAIAEAKDTINIFGSLGSLHVSVLNQGKMQVIGKSGERYEALAPAANLHAPLIDDFITAVLRNREPRVSGETGRTVAGIEEEIYRQAGVPET